LNINVLYKKGHMKISKYLFALTALAVAASSQAAGVASAQNPVSFSENFDDVTNLGGWSQVNVSTAPGQSWFQGNDGIFGSHSGAASSYIGANYLSAADGVGAVDNWLISPEVALGADSKLSFFTRTDGAGFGDKVEVRFSAGSGSDIAGFTTLLTTVGGSAAYPDNGWQQFVAALPSASGTGRFAFRYAVADAANANYIGIDTVSVSAVPEPSTYAVMGIGLVVLALRRRKAQAAS